ncbi:MAG: DNA polymerase III subunit delta [Pseudomonadota bacterium]
MNDKLFPVYLVSGDETLLVQEAVDLIRSAARNNGCTERHVLDSGESGFRWDDLTQDTNALSLFAERRLIELKVANGKFGSDGSKTLQEYLQNASDEDVLLIVSGKIDRASTNSKWYKAIDAAGVTVQIWPIGADALPRWLEDRARSIGLQISREAVAILCDRVEGNLLAAAQELEKLRLVADTAQVSAELVIESVANNARFNLFGMLDKALAGRRTESLRMLHSLRSEGAQPPALLWAFVRELRSLQSLLMATQRGLSIPKALNEARVWKNRQPILGAALQRHTLAGIDSLLALAGEVDGATKGFRPGNAWDQLENLVFALAGDGTYPLAQQNSVARRHRFI